MVRPLLAPLLISVAISAGLASNGAAQQTPPIAPNMQTTPLPPPVGLPAPPAPPPADVPSRPLTADEAALIALRHQPNVTVARANVGAAQGATQHVRAGLLRIVRLSGCYTHQETHSTDGGSVTAAAGGTTGVTT